MTTAVELYKMMESELAVNLADYCDDGTFIFMPDDSDEIFLTLDESEDTATVSIALGRYPELDAKRQGWLNELCSPAGTTRIGAIGWHAESGAATLCLRRPTWCLTPSRVGDQMDDVHRVALQLRRELGVAAGATGTPEVGPTDLLDDGAVDARTQEMIAAALVDEGVKTVLAFEDAIDMAFGGMILKAQVRETSILLIATDDLDAVTERGTKTPLDVALLANLGLVGLAGGGASVDREGRFRCWIEAPRGPDAVRCFREAVVTARCDLNGLRQALAAPETATDGPPPQAFV